MDAKALLQALHTAERLKDATRHCYTSGGRHESVAEHSWRISLMAYWVSDEFPEADMNKVIRMCLIHDLGEAFDLNMHYADDKVAFSPYLTALRQAIREDTIHKMEEAAR